MALASQALPANVNEMETQVDFWETPPRQGQDTMGCLHVHIQVISRAAALVMRSIQDPAKRAPIERVMPALDEALAVLNECSKDVEDAEMEDAVSKQLEATRVTSIIVSSLHEP